jgi:hypothetical protein
MRRTLRSTIVALVSALGLMLGMAAPALAYDPVNIVHTERIQVGPYGMTVGFSTWPLKAMQSLDFTFMPDGGIADKTGRLMEIRPGGGRSGRTEPLSRHPRKRDVWGLDVRSLPTAGDWTFAFTIEGPAGQGTGELRGLKVMDQPGPPLGLSWGISTIPLFGLIALIVVAWRRTRKAVTAAAPA